MGFVYLITNKVNGKQYVGQTMKSVEGRWRGHCKGAERGGQKYLYRAIRVYGKESFTVEVLTESDSFEYIQLAEQLWIQELDTLTPNGYNMTEGGEGSCNFKHTEQTKDRLRVQALEQSEVRSARMKGSKNPQYGQKRTKEEREHLSKAITERNLGKPHPHKGHAQTEETRKKLSDAHRIDAEVEMWIYKLSLLDYTAKEISDTLGVTRKTVSKYINQFEEE